MENTYFSNSAVYILNPSDSVTQVLFKISLNLYILFEDKTKAN